MTTKTDPLGHATTMDYHHTGKVTTYTDAAGKTTQNAFDPNGNLLSTTDPSGSAFSFAYDENEQPTVTTSSVTTANGVETVKGEWSVMLRNISELLSRSIVLPPRLDPVRRNL